jgi:hypothetical protein
MIRVCYCLFQTACLDVLEARGCSFNDPAMTMMGRSLRLGSVVKTLHLENCFLSGRPLMLLGMYKTAYASGQVADHLLQVGDRGYSKKS